MSPSYMSSYLTDFSCFCKCIGFFEVVYAWGSMIQKTIVVKFYFPNVASAKVKKYAKWNLEITNQNQKHHEKLGMLRKNEWKQMGF